MNFPAMSFNVRTLFPALLLSASLSAYGWEINRSFDVEAGGELVVNTDVGAIDVETHDRPTVTVGINVEGYEEDELQIDFRPSAADLTVDLDAPRTRWGWSQSRDRRVSFVIVVPSEYNVDLSTRGGSISVRDLEGKVDVDTSGGTLEFRDIVGNIRGRTSGGSIDADDVDGEIRVSTSGGSIDVNQVTGNVEVDTSGGTISISDVGGSVEADTSGGSIRIEEVIKGVEASTSGGSVRASFSEQPTGDIRLSTSGGSVSVELDSDIAVSVSAYARRIRTDFPIDGVTSAKKRLIGDINGGGPELELESSGGGISIERL